MSWRDAPVYVAAYDLTRWLLERRRLWPQDAQPLSARLALYACTLLEEVALALTFPLTRGSHLQNADHALVRLREHLRLAEDLDLLSARQRRFAVERLEEIGRMVGGWRRRLGTGEVPPPASIG